MNSLVIRRRVRLHVNRRSPTDGTDSRRHSAGGIPRVARLLALAIHFERLLQEGAVRDHAELARLGQISRTRLSQIMNLRYLALDIQEAILFLPPTQKGGPQLTEHHLRPLVAEDDWAKQRRLWDALQTRLTGAAEEG